MNVLSYSLSVSQQLKIKRRSVTHRFAMSFFECLSSYCIPISHYCPHSVFILSICRSFWAPIPVLFRISDFLLPPLRFRGRRCSQILAIPIYQPCLTILKLNMFCFSLRVLPIWSKASAFVACLFSTQMLFHHPRRNCV